jgi:hypothetical protein
VHAGVEVIGAQAFFDNQLTALVIPDSMQWIGQNAFASNQLVTVELGAGLESLGVWVFKDNQLETVILHAITPPLFSDVAFPPFDGNPDLTAIYVPAASVAAYIASAGWSAYAEIIQAI